MTRWFRAATCACLMGLLLAAPAAAQGTEPNSGALSFTGAFDVPSLYLFRGMRQETDANLTMWAAGDLGIELGGGTTINFGVWNSLHTGSSGTGGPLDKLHYEEDFYVAFTAGLGDAGSFTTQYTSYTSPNGAFTTTKEVLFKYAHSSAFGPYGLVAFELGGSDSGQADGGDDKGVYLELGAGPTFPIGSLSVAVPLKLGMSLSDYYELDGEDHKFGYFSIGGLVTIPLGLPERYGSWNFHFGGDYYVLGETTEAFNMNKDGDTSKQQVIGLVGFGVSY